jgi:FixJ family two-component response regulator
MPAISGDELSRQMLKKRASLPIIICTGQNDTFDQQQAEAMNIRGFFKKPVDASTLLARINQLLDEQSAVGP